LQNPRFIEKEEVIRIHAELVRKSGESSAILNEGLLESALYQPKAGFGEEYFHSTIYEQAAAYLFHIACNHAFEQGNKRTAFAVMVTFLNLNDYELTMTEEKAYELTMQVVNHEVDKEQLASILKNYVTELF
jgi:death on curing protein